MSVEVRTTPRTKHLVTRGIQKVEGMNQDLGEQDIEVEIFLETRRPSSVEHLAVMETQK